MNTRIINQNSEFSYEFGDLLLVLTAILVPLVALPLFIF